jgi:hypothetical protein
MPYNQGYFCDGTRQNAVLEALSQERKPERRSGTFFSCHRYNEVRRVLLSYRSSF